MANKSKKIIIGSILLAGGCCVVLFIILAILAGGGALVWFQAEKSNEQQARILEEQWALEDEMARKVEEEARMAEEALLEEAALGEALEEAVQGGGVVKPETVQGGQAVREETTPPPVEETPPPEEDKPAKVHNVKIRHSAPSMLVVGDVFSIEATTIGASDCEMKMVWRSESRSWTTVRLRQSGERHTGSLTLQSDHAPELEYYLVAAGSCDGRSPAGGGLHKARVF